ncbi:MAG: disulfide reductase [Candidatus Zixiibacteriota bacterium]|nr:MAG: disulfide reductase [candidate division Zixibacteria bacterium]
MREYAYYPGCSLEHTASPYDKSVRAVFAALGVNLREIEDWNCCGATMYMSVKKIVGYAISARNLALAQNMGLEICAPCSSCYTILRKANRHIAWDPRERERINEALKAANLSYDTIVKVRHPLDILVHDVGLETIRAAVVRPLTGVKVAPYYGCQIVRPHGGFDDVDNPMTMDKLFTALGADVIDYPCKVRCCGGMLMTTEEEVALKLNYNLLLRARDMEADVMATACPLCQMNLEAYQSNINKAYREHFHMPIVYFTHLLGLALGIAPEKMGMDKLIVEPEKLLMMVRTEEAAV